MDNSEDERSARIQAKLRSHYSGSMNDEALAQALRSIRAMEDMTCKELALICNLLASKMAESGFGHFEMDLIDELIGFVEAVEA